MKPSNLFVFAKAQSFLKVAIWIFLILFAGKYVIQNVFPYFEIEQEVFGRFWDIKWWLVGHILGGLLAITIGPFLFWKAFRTRYITIDRWLGRIYLSAILIGSLSATYMVWTTAIAIHWTWAFGLQVLAFVWISTAAMAFRAIMKRRIQLHKEWIIRSYVITFSTVTFRWLLELPILVGLGNIIERGPTLGWAAWVIPLFITEIILQWNKN